MRKNEASHSAVKSCDASDENLLSRSSSGEGKGKKTWKKVKYQLVEYHALPGYLKDNEHILAHYRAEWPLKQALLSVFSIHNETLNVCTHLFGFFLFLSLTIYTAMKVPNVVDLNMPSALRNCMQILSLVSHPCHICPIFTNFKRS
ncbi:heptahelical transmembrane protein 4-like [Salvia divinorum]|uniref:Heptahelical transmembrane protein 4-like n=1 Tax=Salvia divinorum TaxID=28513 RepID=A0ABD1FZ15_SALDI